MSKAQLHVITDEVLQQRFTHVQLARMAVLGGADVVQYREKRAVGDRERFLVAQAMAQICSDAGVTLVIDDRVDIAAAVGAGVHVGPHDLPVHAAAGLVSLVGATANSLEMALDPDVSLASYLGCGAVFPTLSKGSVPPPVLGLPGLAAIVQRVGVPVVAIGGINPEHVVDVLGSGASGIAVLGGIVLADDPVAATARYVAALRGSDG